MAETRKAESTPKEKSGFNFPCGDFTQMSKMMQNFSSGKGSCDCGKMMQKMFGNQLKETKKE